MEESAVRADPSHDNRPNDSFGRGSQRLVYVLLLVFGLVLIGLGGYARFLEHLSWLPEVTIAAGVAIAAPGILSYLYRKYMLEEIKLEIQKPALEFRDEAVRMVQAALEQVAPPYRAEIQLLSSAKEAGLVGVYISRAEALLAFLPFLENEQHEIMLVGSSLRGLLTEFDPEYEKARELLLRKIGDRVRLRVLVTHPIIADLRAGQENRGMQDIGTEIMGSLQILLNEWKLPADDLHLYLGTPTCFGLKTASAMLLNTYPYMKEAFASPCIVVRKPGYFYEHFHSSHFRAWASAIALPVPPDLTTLRGALPAYATAIKELMRHLEG